MSVVVTLECKAKAGSMDELKSTLSSVLPDTRTFDGCHGVVAYTDQDDGDAVFLIEHWDSRAHYEKYFQWRVDTGAIDALGALLAGPPTIRYFDAFDG